MSNKIQISINIINEMKKLRTSTYSDRTSWVEELIQNTQRSDSRNVKITIKDDKFIIEDDGIGCDNPNIIFEKNTSGWGEEVTNSDNPFGEGFFSTIVVANKIKIRSNGFESLFDVEKMFNYNTLDCITVKGSSRRSGFVVELTQLEDDYDPYNIEEKVKETVKYIDNINFYLNGTKLKHKNFTDTDNELAHIIENNDMTGWIAPFKWGYSYDGFKGDLIKLYAQGRFVKDLHYNNVSGVIQMTNNSLDLRSPDRKDVIDNYKYVNFKSSIMKEIKSMFFNILETGGDEEIDKYADTISSYLDINDYQSLIKFVYLNDYDNIEDIISTMNDINDSGNDVPSFNEVAKSIGDMNSEDVIDRLELCDYTTTESNARTTSNSKSERTGRELKSDKAVFYVKKDEVQDYLDKLELAEYYNMDVILVRNNLEEEVLIKNNILHIIKLNETVKLSASLTRVGAINDIEKRAMYLFEIISKTLRFDNNIFKIGDMTTYKNIKVGNTNNTEIVEDEAIALAQGSNIYINREYLNDSNLKASDSKEILNSDIRFIINNLKTISHELAHIMFNTIDNTKEHAEAQIEISDIILQSLFNR